MKTIATRALFARALLTAGCLCALALIRPLRPVHAQEGECANGRCEGVSLCIYRPGESCAFLDRRTCVTYRCKVNET